MEDDWGLIPMPKVSASQEKYGSWIDHNTPMIAMPKTNTDYETSGLILDALCNLSHQLVVPAFQEQTANLNFRDEESSEMLEIIMDSAYYDPAFFLRQAIPDIGLPVGIINDVMMGNAEFASAYEGAAGKIQSALDQFFKQGSYAE